MNHNYILPLAELGATLEIVGGKAASLARLARAELPVPDGFYITTAAYQQFITANNLQRTIDKGLLSVDLADPHSLDIASREIRQKFSAALIPEEISEMIQSAYTSRVGIAVPVAVRSSATAEDLPDASFAGQQDTFLNIQGPQAVLEAVRQCWASLWEARAIAYRSSKGFDSKSVALAVVVQTLVDAQMAGIMFTANPINGRRDQMLISASWGLGEAVVAGLVTPDNLTIDKASTAVMKRETGEKLVQTVCTAKGVENQPVPEHLQHAQTLSDTQASNLAGFGLQIEALYGTPMDIEWAWANGQFVILQARPITALPEVEIPSPNEWKLPPGAYSAMRNNIVELMIDPLTPLFSTLGLNSVNTSMNKQMEFFLGDSGILPVEPIITVNHYAYYNGSISAKSILKILLRSVEIMKLMFTGAVERWTETGRPKYIAFVENWEKTEWRQLPATEILTAVKELSLAAIDAYIILVSGVIPAAWISEALFTFAYKLVKLRNEPPAPTFLLGFDSLPILAEKALYDLSVWAHEHDDLTNYLKKTPAAKLALQYKGEFVPQGIDRLAWQTWQLRLQSHLKKFGYTIYNLDFANPTPADDPVALLETFKLFLSGQGVNPHTRQLEAAERREQATKSMEHRLKGVRLSLFRKNLARAQKYAPLREDSLAEIGLSYPLLRKMLFELGSRFTRNGLIQQPEDIFWLEQAEVETAADRLDKDQPLKNLSDCVLERKTIWRAALRLSPPLMLPQIKIFGRDLAEIKSGKARKAKGNTLKGVAASPGSLTAPACVIHNPEEFAALNTGDVLVAPLTTPAWTPLFARAGAIVTDIGGPLSHGSIVAREYGIPAVLGTGEATKRIHTGQLITVDGDTGLVTMAEVESV